MEPILIDVNEYVHSGEGANGESLNHRTDPNIMVKLYNSTAPYQIIVNELDLAHKVYDAGIDTPKPGDFVTDGKGRYGIRFERIQNKISFSRAVGDNPERVEEYARRFARMCLKLHSVHLDTTKFENIKDVDLRELERNPFFTPEEKRRSAEFIKNVPEADTAIHGDLQFSNAIMSGDKEYFIDLGDFAYGHPYFDVGMVYVCCCCSKEEFIRETFHMEKTVSRKFWYYFAKEYFGEEADIDRVTEMIKPYAGLKLLIIERNSGCYMPEFHPLLP